MAGRECRPIPPPATTPIRKPDRQSASPLHLYGSALNARFQNPATPQPFRPLRFQKRTFSASNQNHRCFELEHITPASAIAFQYVQSNVISDGFLKLESPVFLMSPSPYLNKAASDAGYPAVVRRRCRRYCRSSSAQHPMNHPANIRHNIRAIAANHPGSIPETSGHCPGCCWETPHATPMNVRTTAGASARKCLGNCRQSPQAIRWQFTSCRCNIQQIAQQPCNVCELSYVTTSHSP